MIALKIRTRAGDEIEVNLHPISLAKIAAELIEDAAGRACRRRGHDGQDDEPCKRCGLFLPDNGSPYGAWLAEAYRTIRKKDEQ